MPKRQRRERTTRSLPRGGVLVETKRGSRIQFGIPPETIKDTMALPGGVPDTYVIPEKMFDVERGLSLSEVEFPIYFNLFVKKRPLTVVGSQDQLAKVKAIVRMTLLTAPPKNLHREFALGASDPAIPMFDRELAFFHRHPALPHRNLRLSDALNLIPFVGNRAILSGGVSIRLDRRAGLFRLLENGTEAARIPVDIQIPGEDPDSSANATFEPPVFGVTALGNGSGFDLASSTSGLVIWANRQGVVVDPPVDAPRRLHAERIHPRLIRDVILTHYHADHDAGVLQKILEEGIVTLHTTETVLNGFVRKATLITGLTKNEIRKMIDFRPVAIGTPIHILGAAFTFFYTFHSVPTIGFKVSLGRKSITYSADHLNDQEVLSRLHHQGILTEGRYESLRRFPWNSSLVIHEAGVAPIHTPPESLAKLPERIRRKLFIVHTNEERIAGFPGLKLLGQGEAPTQDLGVRETPVNLHEQIIRTASHVSFLHGLPLGRAADLLQMARLGKAPAAERLITRGETGDVMYIILRGTVDVIREGKVYKTYGPGDFVGEMALVSDEPRFADVIARTDLTYVSIAKADFLSFLEATRAIPQLRRLADIRREDSWPLLTKSPIFDFMTPRQVTELQGLLAPCRLAKGSLLPRPDDPLPVLYVVIRGSVHIEGKNGKRLRGKRGTAVAAFGPGAPRRAGQLAEGADFYRASGRPLRGFLQRNPGVRLRLAHRIANPERFRGRA